MKTNKIFVCLLLSLAMISCKTEEKKEEKNDVVAEQNAVNPNVFKVTLNATVKKDDSFQIYYKETPEAAFDEKDSFFIEFKGSEQPQDIVFSFPEDVFPNYFRLDFGTNKEQSEIVVNSFKMSYLDKNVEIKGADFFNYFIPNELTMKVDKAGSKITPIIAKDGAYDPMTYSDKGLYEQIQLMIQ